MPQKKKKRWLMPEMQGWFGIQKFVNKIHHTKGSNEKKVLEKKPSNSGTR